MRVRLAVTAVVLLIVSACTPTFDVRTSDLVGRWQGADGSWVAAGDDPPDFPLIVVTWRGPAHCDWQSVIFLELAWPLGTVHRGPHTEEHVRRYVRDPDAKLAEYVEHAYDGNVTLSAFATPTGFHRQGNELFVDPDGDAYVRRPAGHVERWPRASTMIACA